MKRWSTEILAVNQKTQELGWIEGMVVIAPTREMAQAILDKYDYNYLVLGDEIVCEIPCKPGTLDPDWNKMVDYDVIREN